MIRKREGLKKSHIFRNRERERGRCKKNLERKREGGNDRFNVLI